MGGESWEPSQLIGGENAEAGKKSGCWKKYFNTSLYPHINPTRVWKPLWNCWDFNPNIQLRGLLIWWVADSCSCDNLRGFFSRTCFIEALLESEVRAKEILISVFDQRIANRQAIRGGGGEKRSFPSKILWPDKPSESHKWMCVHFVPSAYPRGGIGPRKKGRYPRCTTKTPKNIAEKNVHNTVLLSKLVERQNCWCEATWSILQSGREFQQGQKRIFFRTTKILWNIHFATHLSLKLIDSKLTQYQTPTPPNHMPF